MIKCTSKYELAVSAFDFAGCGNSEEDYLTYGLNEADDVNQFLLAIDKYIKHRTLTVWGRSMGAVTAIMFADRYRNDVDCLVLDGPFKNLSTIVERASYEASKLPMPIIKAFLYFVKRKVD
jgi:pimeloyl-ACP methyl ester carboxylesterase